MATWQPLHPLSTAPHCSLGPRSALISCATSTSCAPTYTQSHTFLHPVTSPALAPTSSRAIHVAHGPARHATPCITRASTHCTRPHVPPCRTQPPRCMLARTAPTMLSRTAPSTHDHLRRTHYPTIAHTLPTLHAPSPHCTHPPHIAHTPYVAHGPSHCTCPLHCTWPITRTLHTHPHSPTMLASATLTFPDVACSSGCMLTRAALTMLTHAALSMHGPLRRLRHPHIAHHPLHCTWPHVPRCCTQPLLPCSPKCAHSHHSNHAHSHSPIHEHIARTLMSPHVARSPAQLQPWSLARLQPHSFARFHS